MLLAFLNLIKVYTKRLKGYLSKKSTPSITNVYNVLSLILN
jgi:hypothetical protein